MAPDLLSRVETWFKNVVSAIIGQTNDAYFVSDLVPPGATRDYETKLKSAGRITGVWFQFYWTTALLQYSITLDGSPIIKTMNGSEPFIALHNVSVTFPTNTPFQQGALLKITATNTDSTDPHRVRCQVFIQYASS